MALIPGRRDQDSEIRRIQNEAQSVRDCDARRERLVSEVRSALTESAEANRRSERAHAVTPEASRRPFR